MKNDFADALGSTRDMPNGISIQGNRFWLASNEGTVPAPDPLRLHFVVLGSKKPMSRRYYASPYSATNPTGPDCYSPDGVTPDGGENMQHPTCAGCPKSVWGSEKSRLTGALVPACRQHKDMVVKVMGVPGKWMFSIPPASIKKNWDPLVKRIQAMAKDEEQKNGQATLCMANCVIEATFAPGVNGIMEFKPRGYLAGEEEIEVVELHKDRESIEVMLWGPKGSERKAQYEGTRAGPVQPVQVVLQEPPKQVTAIFDASPPNMDKPTLRRNNKAPVTESADDVNDVLKSMGIEL
jgi:hypothetical protein